MGQICRWGSPLFFKQTPSSPSSWVSLCLPGWNICYQSSGIESKSRIVKTTCHYKRSSGILFDWELFNNNNKNAFYKDQTESSWLDKHELYSLENTTYICDGMKYIFLWETTVYICERTQYISVRGHNISLSGISILVPPWSIPFYWWYFDLYFNGGPHPR